MYLSKEMQSTPENDASWTKFELQPVDSISLSMKNESADFISLQVMGDNEKVFAPLVGNGGGTGNMSRENMPNSQERIALVEKDAYEKGFAQGEKDGIELGEAKAEKLVKNIEALLDDFSRLKLELVKQYEKEILEIIYAIAEKVIHTHLDFNETAVKDTIFSALKLTAEKRNISVKINPEDFEYVEKIRPELFSRHTNIKSLMITPDPAISRGGCVLETPSGDMDASIETQLEIIHQSLKDAYMG